MKPKRSHQSCLDQPCSDQPCPEHPSDPQQHCRPRAVKDKQLLALLALSLITGLGLWYVLPAGFAAHIVASPWLLINVLLLYPLVEELLFRGVIQGALLRHEGVNDKRLSRPLLALKRIGISRANSISSLLFVGLHFLNHSPLWALAVLLPSLALGYMRERYGHVIAPMLLHIFFNAIYLFAGS